MDFLNSYQRARLLLVSGSVLCFCVFWWVGAALRLPIHPGQEASLLQQPSPVVAVLAVAATFAACVAAGTAIAGMVRFNAGLVTAGAGLVALSVRGGNVRETIFHGLATGAGARTFLHLAGETAILGVVCGVAWWALLRLHRAGVVRDREGPAVFDEPTRNTPLFLAMQTVVTAAAVALLATRADKQQVLAAVAIGSFAGAAAAQTAFPAAARAAYWLPPFVVGIGGYLLAYFNPAGIETADLTTWSAALARPLPLDYAAVGPAGAVLGHWMARRWSREGEEAQGDGVRTAPASGSALTADGARMNVDPASESTGR